MYNQSLSVMRYSVSNQTLIVDYDYHSIEVTGGNFQMLCPEIARKVKKFLAQRYTPKGSILQYHISHPKVSLFK